MIRSILLKNDKLKILLEKRLSLAKEYQKTIKELERLDNERQIFENKLTRLVQDKIKPLMTKLALKETDLGEFEILTEVRIKGDKVEVDVADQVEFYKEELRKKINERKGITKEDGGGSESKTGDDKKNGAGEGIKGKA